MSSDIAHPAITELATSGNPRGTVVFIHGSMDRSDSFRRVTRNLPEWKLVSYDRRGWGKSRTLGSPGTTLSNHVADAITILSKLDRAIVVGHSYGGLIALCTVDTRLDLIRAVVAFEPPVRWLPWWPLQAPWERLIRESADDGPEAIADALHRAVVGHPRIPHRRRQPNSPRTARHCLVLRSPTPPCRTVLRSAHAWHSCGDRGGYRLIASSPRELSETRGVSSIRALHRNARRRAHGPCKPPKQIRRAR